MQSGTMGLGTSTPADGTAKDAITIVDESGGIKGLGPDGTLALGGMVIAAAAAAVIAWRAIARPSARRR